MIDHAAIYLFRDAVVVTTIASLHVKYRNAATGRDERRQSAVCIAKQQQTIRFLNFKQCIDLRQDLTDLFAEAIRDDSEMMVGCADFEIADEDVAQALVVILARVYGYVFAMLVEQTHYQT